MLKIGCFYMLARISLYVADIIQKDSIMTPSIDPNFTPNMNRQFNDQYNWLALVSQNLDTPHSHNPVQSVIQFLNRFISYESIYGDSDGAQEMVKVLLIMQSVDSPVSDSQVSQTKKSYEYVCAYLEILNETCAPFDVCLQFERLQEVLLQLIQMRQQMAFGVLCSYGQLNLRLKLVS